MTDTILELGTTLDIYILCRDRVDYIEDCIQSVLVSSSGTANVIISDNSIGDSVYNLIKKQFPRLKYIKRSPSISFFLDHYRLILNESTSDYIVFFHDDDIMNPCYITNMLSTIIRYPGCSGIACNAQIIKNLDFTTQTMFTSVNLVTIVSDFKVILESYFSLDGYAPPPFPSYLYRTSSLKATWASNFDGGKHSDILVLLNLLSTGYIIWYNEPLISYRVHSNHLSSIESISERLKLARSLYKSKLLHRRSALSSNYRFFYWARWYLQNIRKIVTKRWCTKKNRVVFLFFIKNFQFLFKRKVLNSLLARFEY